MMHQLKTLSESEKAFKEANKIMSQITRTLPNITPVTVNDLSLFEEFFKQEGKQRWETHGNGFSYIIQMMNQIGEEGKPKLGYKYYDSKNLIPLVTYPKIDTLGFALYFIRPVGINPIEKIIELTKILRDSKFKYPIYVKKIFENQKNHLLTEGYESIEKLPWHSEIPTEDDTFPEQIINSNTTLDSINTKKSKSLENSYRTVMKLYDKHHVTFNEENFEGVAWEITESFFTEVVPLENNKLNLSSPNDYYNMIFHNPKRDSLIKKIVYIDNVPQGYYIGEKHDDKINLYALISLRNYLNISSLMIFDIVRDYKDTTINLGGSEDVGIHNFKLKFNPVEENKMYWVVNLQ